MHEPALLAAIRADPDDDVPRMIYADMLLSKNPRDRRGLLVHDQLAVARGEAPPAITNRANQLLEEHQRTWDAAILRDLGLEWHPTLPFELAWERGFPAVICARIATLIAHRAVIASQPITKLDVVDADPLLAFAEMPELAGIRVLRLAAAPGLDAGALETLARTPHLTALRDFEVANGHLDEYGALALAGARWLPQLERLALPGSALTDDAMRALFAPGRLPRLRVLELDDIELGEGAAAALLDARPPLRRLALSGAIHDPIIAEAVLGSPLVASVEELELSDSNVGGAGARALASSARSLRRLGLHHAAVTTADAVAIVRAGLPLEHLDLRANALGPEVAVALAGAALPALHTLLLSENRLGHAGLDALVGCRGLPALRRLGIFANQLFSGETGWPSDAFDRDPYWDEYNDPEPLEYTREQLREKFGKRRELDLV